MALLVDHQIRHLATVARMLEPFSEQVQEGGVISFGLTHAGYDLRLGRSYLVFKNSFNEIISPKRMKDDKAYRNRVFDEVNLMHDHMEVIIPPNGYILGYTLEYIRMPYWLKGRCVGKSSLARCGIIVNTTPLEPSWEGHLTLEIANVTPCPVEIYTGEGVAQLEFEMLDQKCEKTYADKSAKYQKQGPEPVPAKVI
jgi:dCTP deaminase